MDLPLGAFLQHRATKAHMHLQSELSCDAFARLPRAPLLPKQTYVPLHGRETCTYRFHGVGGDKVWAVRGTKHVKCKELRKALLERWTGITAVFSRPHPSATLVDGGWQPKWTALFDGKDGSRMDLHSPSHRCQLLFAEHGSVTSASWLEYVPFVRTFCHGLSTQRNCRQVQGAVALVSTKPLATRRHC